jgi:hypothetical protein
MRKIAFVLVLSLAMILCLGVFPQMVLAKKKQPPPPPPNNPPSESVAVIMWIDHLDFLPGDDSVKTLFNSVNSGVGGGLSGLIIESTTTGEDATGGGNKVVEKGLQVPPGFLISGVRVCYELSNARSFISQIRLAQVQDPPSTALVLLDDGTDLTNAGPVCVNSTEVTTPIDPSKGAVRLNFRVDFGDITDRIVLRAVGLNLLVDPNGPLQKEIEGFENHTHIYLTGKGQGHNNTQAETGPPVTE